MESTVASSPLASELAIAEQSVRRGDLVTAAIAYERLTQRFPGDERVRSRAEDIRAQLLPAELEEVRRRAGGDTAAAPARSEPGLSPLERAEALVNAGRLDEAVAEYERLLATDPSNGLLAERLEELRRAGAAPSLTETPPTNRESQAQPPDLMQPEAATASVDATSEPSQPPVSPSPSPPSALLPDDPIEALTTLLMRVRSAPRRG